MKSKEIRQQFLEFFESKQHSIVPSAPMVVKDDPTLMFTNAGMNQFKDVFLGNSIAKDVRVVNSQKCLRVSGKHNDLEEVGVDTYHHTMFEMLGNWSFGDYFKKEAINWAWELLTEVYKINKDDLYITIFGGDKKDGLPIDEEALAFWKEIVDESRILHCSKKDNFWEMGDIGPCGPCSEIHVDIRSAEEKAKLPGKELVNEDHPQVIEIWNLVFMEYTRMANGELVPLPNKHIDTGMGFERLAVVLQKKSSNYDTDVFSPLINKIEEISNTKYGATDSKEDIAIRVISDHVRAVSFSIADGQLPSNTGAGYVIRRILRRAIRYSYSFLNISSPFIFQLTDILKEQMGEFFPELASQHELIRKVIKEEEESFLRTLAKGIKRLDDIISKTSGNILDGKIVFELYDTYGFPVDLTALIASEVNKEVDEQGFEDELNKQRERSRAVGKIEAGDWIELIEDEVTEFIGYDHEKSTVKITKYRKVSNKGKDFFQLVFNITPFYPEGGGQVGDTGCIQNANEKVFVIDTKKENNLIIHIVKELPKNMNSIFTADVNMSKRNATAKNHSATHLLHQALREVLGTHVEQKGSLVNSDYLRFDFSHFSKVENEDLRKIEQLINSRITQNIPLTEHRAIPISEAEEKGAMMLFGEKYGDIVRMIQFGESKELCGGIHVPFSGSIGFFKISSESAIAAGVRRIEAITSVTAEKYLYKALDELKEVKDLLKNPKDGAKAVGDLISKNSELQKQVEKFNQEKAKGVKQSLKSKVREVGGISFLAERVELGASEIKDIAFQMRGENENLFAVFGSVQNDKPLLTVVISDKLVSEKDLNAGKIIRDLATSIKGGGGGQAFFASAGGKDVSGLDEALKKAENYLS